MPEVNLQAVLIDAYDPKRYGGTGEIADWKQLADQRTMLGRLPLVLAGGLNAENVAEAILTVRPDAVDTASGVEREPGEKDPQAVAAFAEAAHEAFASLSR